MTGRHSAGQGGMTLVEVALAIVIGLIVMIAAAQAFSFAKRSAIRTKQMKNVEMFKSMVEQLKAAEQSGVPDNFALKSAQMASFVDRVPNLGRDPYTGSTRQLCDLGGTCPQGSVFSTFGPVATDSTLASINEINPRLTTNSDLIYLYGARASTKFTIMTADGISKDFLAYVILESDSDGKIVAVAGGGVGDE